MKNSTKKPLISEEFNTAELAKEIRKHASESHNEEDLKIRVETLLDPIRKKWGIERAKYEDRHMISGGRKDALYGTVIIEYKAPNKLNNKALFEKFKKKMKEYIQKEAADPRNFGRYFGVILDGNNIAFIRYRINDWEEQDRPLEVNGQTVLRLLEAIRGLRRKPIDVEFLLTDFGPKSEISKKNIVILYEALIDKNHPRTDMLFADWRRVFSQVCAYSPDKLSGLIDYYGLSALQARDVEKLLFAVHSYYTILMKLLTSEIVTIFADSLLGSYLKRLEEAHMRGGSELVEELKELETGGIFSTVGIKNFLEADYFSWYLDEWNEKIAGGILDVVKKLLDYEPATIELNPERVKDLFKRLYQNLVPRDIRHRLGEYFTPDWLAELVLNEVDYKGDSEKKLLDPACGSGTFLVLAIKRIKEYAEEHFVDKRELVQKIVQNIKGIDLNPLAVLASKANYLIALADLIRYRPREGLEIPIYLADSISVERTASLFGTAYTLHTTVGEFSVPSEVIQNQQLSEVLSILSEGVKTNQNDKEFREFLQGRIHVSESGLSLLVKLYSNILKLEKQEKNRIWLSLLKNSFAPVLIGKFDYVVGNPPWVNWENLPEHYRNREGVRELWRQYGLLEGIKSAGMGKVRRDLAALFVVRCFSEYVKKTGALSFLIPYNILKTQGGAGFRKYIYNNTELLKVHELSELHPFEGAINRTGLIVIRGGTTKFPVDCEVWFSPVSQEVGMEDELSEVKKLSKQVKMITAPIVAGRPDTPWMVISADAYKSMKKIGKSTHYSANEGVNTALNGVYWVEILSKQPGGLLIENTSTSGLKKKVKKISRVVEPDLIFPLARGRDVKKWLAEPDGYIILPHDPESGAPVDEKRLKITTPESFKYFLNYSEELEIRSIHKLWGKGRPFYAAYDIGGYTFKPYKVAYKDISGKISAKGEFGGAAVIAPAKDKFVGNKVVIPDNTLMFISCKSLEECHYLAAILNSVIVRLVATAYAVLHVRGHIIKYMGIQKFEPNNSLHKTLVSLSKEAHELASKIYIKSDKRATKELKKVEKQIDEHVAEAYKMDKSELKAIKKALHVLKETGAEE